MVLRPGGSGRIYPAERMGRAPGGAGMQEGSLVRRSVGRDAVRAVAPPGLPWGRPVRRPGGAGGAGHAGGCAMLRRVVRWVWLAAMVGLQAAAAGALAQDEGQDGPPGAAPEVSLVIANVYAVTWEAEPGAVWPVARVSPQPVDIAVAGDRIVAIGPGLAARYPEARFVDGGGGYAIPGLIDVHVHAGGAEFGANAWPLFADVFSGGRVKGAHALDAGVTTLRSAGDAFPGVVQMRDAWESDPAAMPRLELVGPMVTAPGGHPVSTIFRGTPWIYRPATRQVASPEQARAEARRILESPTGAPAVLKAIYTDGGGRLPRLSREALQALVEEARQAGAVVIAHTDTVEELIDAVEAGVWGVEHGVTSGERLTAEQARRIAERGVFYSPTLAVIEQVNPAALAAAMENVRAVYASGAPVVAGTDGGNPGVMFGLSLLREVELLHRSGLSAADALAAATYQAARYVRRAEALGRLAPGYVADVVVLARNPLQDPGALREVRAVVRSGRVARLQQAGRVDGRWRLEPFLGFEGLVVGGSAAQRTDGPVKLRADAGYALSAGRGAFRLRAELGRSQATAGFVQVGDWPGTPVLGRRGQQGLTAGVTVAAGEALRLRLEGGLVRLWQGPEEAAPPGAAYGRAVAGYRWLFDPQRLGTASLEVLGGRTEDGAALAAAEAGVRVELGGLRARLQAGASRAWGAGLEGFAFRIGGPYGAAVLRGYPEDALVGERFAAAGVEYRWLPAPDLPFELYAFTDAAAVWGTSPPSQGPSPSQEPAWGLSVGVGAGMSAGTLGSSRLDLALTRTGRLAPVFWFEARF